VNFISAKRGGKGTWKETTEYAKALRNEGHGKLTG
jgi:hypothetical protein